MSYQKIKGRENRKFLIFEDYIDWLCLWKGIAAKWDNGEEITSQAFGLYENLRALSLSHTQHNMHAEIVISGLMLVAFHIFTSFTLR